MAILVALGGAVLGPSIGIGANVGWIIGAVIGTLLFPPPPIEGPRLGDLTVSASTYGQPVPIAYGTLRMSGNMIWSTGLEEEKRTEKVGGKGGLGGAKQNTYYYFSTFAMAFCEGVAQDILRIWADGKLIFDKTGSDDEITKVDLNFRFYPGDEEQEPDSLVEDDVGDGLAPGHRGLCYVVFDRLPLEDFGNRVPNITAEITFNATAARPSVDANLFTPGEGGEASTFLSDGVLLDHLREVLYTSQSSVTVGQNVLRRLDARTMVEQRQRAYTVDALSNNVQFLRVILVTPEGFVVAATDSGNTQPISVINPETLDIEATFGTSGAGTDNDPAGFESLAEGRSSFVVALGQEGTSYFFLSASVFNSIGVLDVTNGAATYIWDSDSAPGQSSPRIDSYARILGTCPGLPGTGFGDGYIIAGPNYSSPSSGAFTLYRITVGQSAFYDSSSGAYVGVDLNIVRTFTPSDLSSAADNGFVPFFGTQIGAFRGPLFDFSDNSIMFQFSNADLDEHFMAKVDASSGAVLWVTEIPEIRNEVVGFNISSVRLGYYGQMDGSTGWRLRTSDGVVVDPSLSGWSVNHNNAGFGLWDDKMSAFVGFSANGITRWLFGRGSGGAADMEDIIKDLCSRAGLDPDADVDASELSGIPVPGYVIGRQTQVRDGIQPLANLAFFDGVESDHVLTFRLRDGKSVAASLTQTDMAVLTGNTGEFFRENRIQETELPLRFSITYMDRDNDYQQAVHNAKRIRSPDATMRSGNEQAVQLPMVLTAATAKQAAEKALYSAWNERSSYSLRVPWTHVALDPADVVQITLDDGTTVRARLAQMDVGLDLSLDLSAVGEQAAQYTSTVEAAKGESGIVNTFLASRVTKVIFVSSPLLRDRDDTGRATSVMYAFLGGYGQPGWRTGSLFRSVDSIEYDLNGSVVDEMTWGSTKDALGDVADPWITDEENEVTVYLNTGELSSITQLQMVNGANAAAIVPKGGGDPEIIQFRDAAQNADGSYTLSGLLRGRRGTEVNTGGHSSGDTFVLLVPDAGLKVVHEISEKDLSRSYKAVTTGTLVEDSLPVAKADPANDLKPYAVVEHAAVIDGMNDITLTWTRRTRVGGGLQDGTGTVPVSEDAEEYELEIFDGPSGTEVRQVTGLTSPTYEYISADQTSDGFSPPLTQITVRVYQISAQVGRGFSEEVTIDVE